MSPGDVTPEEEHQFCCLGCRTVYQVLHQHGLTAYYDYREAGGVTPAPARATSKSYPHFDEQTFHDLYVRVTPRGASTRFLLEGVHCAACVWLIERLPRLLPGLIEARLDFGKSQVTLLWDPDKLALSRVAEALDRLGYPPHPPRADQQSEVERIGDRRLLVRIAIAGAAAGNSMMMAIALYTGLFDRMAPEHEAYFRWLSLLLTLPSMGCASVFFRGAWSALRTRVPHMDLPISIGIIAGFARGAYNTWRGAGEIYFDSVATLIFLLLVGRWVQRRYHRRASRAAELMYALAPASARLVEGLEADGCPTELDPLQGNDNVTDYLVREVPLEAVKAGALVEVRAGERVPVDGTVQLGSSELDVAWLTGEARPRQVEPGATVHAGTVNIASRLLVKALKTGAETRMGQLMQQVEDAQTRRAKVAMLADRLSGYFTLAVLSLALITAMLWWGKSPDLAIEYAVALLIVTCPCALGNATPLALSAALGRAAKAGLLIRGGDVFERLRGKGRIVFDKTGTLTLGRLTLTQVVGDARLLPWVLALEQTSAHTIARALVSGLGARLTVEEQALAKRLPLEGVKERLGEGLTATLEGQRLRLGHARGAGELPAWASEAVSAITHAGESPVLLSVDDEVRLVLGLGDPIRAEVPETLKRLGELGYELAILSGDHPDTVSAVAASLGVPFVEVVGGASPERKLELVERWGKEQTVVMVGDGVNDAAALSAASVGVSVHGGAEASLQAADVFATQPGIEPVRLLVVGARQALHVVHRNLGFSLAYNLVGVTLAMVGVLNPLIASLLMPLSSLTVAGHSYRSRSFES
ncbi:MAG: heavy metal translocating P-type ATPase [Polyangiaceae bacterium]|nr:heavy metal translocating P-type ATPase [Polyangiaceae bacterium]